MSGVDSLLEKRKSQMSLILNWSKGSEDTVKLPSSPVSSSDISLTMNESIASLFGNAVNKSPKPIQATSSPIDTTGLEIADESIRQLVNNIHNPTYLSSSFGHCEVEASLNYSINLPVKDTVNSQLKEIGFLIIFRAKILAPEFFILFYWIFKIDNI